MKKRVVAAYAESAGGPGWGNTPIWVLVQDRDGTYTVDCIQPSDQTEEMVTLYRVSQAAHLAMTGAVKRAWGRD
jgi:hypothetical protein